MERFSYKGVCGICERTRIKVFKRRAGLGYRFIINTMLFKTVSYASKILKNKAVFNLKRYCMHCYVTLSNVFQLMCMYPLFTDKKAGQL